MVDVISGTLEGNRVEVLSINMEEKTAKVSVYILGKESSVEVPLADLKKVED